MKHLYLIVVCASLGLAQEALPSVQELKNGNLLFSTKTYKELASLNNNNFLVCPLSVLVGLALLEAGAGGKTAHQLLTGLNLPDSDEKTQQAFKIVAPTLDVKNQYTLTSANKVYLNKGFELNPQYKEIATNIFNADVQTIDFGGANAVSDINEWVLQKTQNKIKDLLESKDVNKDTRAILVNALYFYGEWTSQFEARFTEKRSFYALGKNQINIDTMEQTNTFNYCEDSKLNAKFLEMDYKGGDVSITFVLPNDIDGLASLETNIAEVLKPRKYSSEEVHVQIPKVTIDYKVDFIPILQHFGIEDVFSPAANLSGIEAHAERLFVSKVVQKTFISIGEEGTTAAAATAVVILPGAAAPPLIPPKEFNADHPFIFYLKYPHGILFVGRYVGADIN